MKFLLNVCLRHEMIPIVFSFNQIRAERMAFDRPPVMATELGSQILIYLKIH